MDDLEGWDKVNEMRRHLTLARLGELVRTQIRLSAALHSGAEEGGELKRMAWDLHVSSVRLAEEAGMKKGSLADDVLCPTEVAQRKEIRRLEAEVERLEGGGVPQAVAEAERRERDTAIELERAKTKLRECEGVMERVAVLVQDYAPRDDY